MHVKFLKRLLSRGNPSPVAAPVARAQYHFVDEYEKAVADLVAKHPIDEAMSLAVGGNYEAIGDALSDFLIFVGLKDGMDVFDFGCGSGRVAVAIARKVDLMSYTGSDVVQALLDYANARTPAHYRFILNRTLDIPAGDESKDMVFAFSVFTHLLQAECFLYLQDMHRILKPGGTAVISFLEFARPTHWTQFTRTVDETKSQSMAVLNTFIERNQIACWAHHIGLDVEAYYDEKTPDIPGGMRGQTAVVLRKPDTLR